MNIGIMGAGKIAGVMADTINKMDDVELYAVGSRTLEKANAFAGKFDIDKTYGSYEELVSDDAIDLIYIATPHSHHYEHMKLCIEHGRNVLCEKAFTYDAAQAEEIAALAAEKKVYVAEAIWTRYMPSRQIINEILESGVIGDIRTMTCNLSYPISKIERLIRPELAGGCPFRRGSLRAELHCHAYGKGYLGY